MPKPISDPDIAYDIARQQELDDMHEAYCRIMALGRGKISPALALRILQELKNLGWRMPV